MDIVIIIIYSAISAMIPLMLAGLGELVCEKSGVLNLGLEGTMIMGCVSGFIAAFLTNSLVLGFIVAIFAGMGMSLLFGVFVVYLKTNQVATGLALTIFGIGLSAFLGLEYEGSPLDGLQNIYIPILSDLPVVGQLLFQHDVVVYLTFALLFFAHYFFKHMRWGLIVRAVGENHHAAFSMGYSVKRIRLFAVLFGGAMTGMAGAYLSLVYTPLWAENMTAGRGWIALVLVVFAAWQPIRLLFGAFLFGLVSIFQLFLQGNTGFLNAIPTEIFSMLPYLTTIIVLVILSSQKQKNRYNAPGNLGTPFQQ